MAALLTKNQQNIGITAKYGHHDLSSRRNNHRERGRYQLVQQRSVLRLAVCEEKGLSASLRALADPKALIRRLISYALNMLS
eukprot:6187903-Pleurochrysis_carterae.AAC.1